MEIFKNEEKIKLEKECEICNEKATKMCFDCSSIFCDSCLEFVHDKKVNSKHKIEEIEFFIFMDIKCPEHPKIPMNLFCVDEKSKKLIYFFIYRNLLSFLLL